MKMHDCVNCKKKKTAGGFCSTSCGIKYFDKKYPNRKHYHVKGKGYYFEWKDKPEEKYNTSFYSGTGYVLRCMRCDESIIYTTVMEKKEFDKLIEIDFRVANPHRGCKNG